MVVIEVPHEMPCPYDLMAPALAKLAGICVCMYLYKFIRMNIYIYTFIFIFVYMCV